MAALSWACIRGSRKLVLRPKLRNAANQRSRSTVRWQPIFPLKADAGSIGNVVDAASVNSAIMGRHIPSAPLQSAAPQPATMR
jgi:hypothetical protein